MERLATVKIDLEISAQRIISQFQTNNKQLEDAITKGIERALSEVLEDDNFENIVVATVKEEIRNTVKRAASDWSVRNKIQQSILTSIDKKIENLADEWANKALKNIEEK